jgi:hypothetical protein
VFCVGGVQFSVTFGPFTVVLGAVLLPADGLVPDAGDELLADGLLGDELLGDELLLLGVEVPVDPVVALPESPPHAESASPSAPASEMQTKRYDPSPRLASFMIPPNVRPRTRSVRTKSSRQGIARSRSNAKPPFLHEVLWPRSSADRVMNIPGNPAVMGFAPLDRKFCAPAFRRVCLLCPRGSMASRCAY